MAADWTKRVKDWLKKVPDGIRRVRELAAGHFWSLVTLAVLVLGSVLVHAAAGWWHAQMQAAEARGRQQAMTYRAPEPGVVPRVTCPEPVRSASPKRQPTARPAAPASGATHVPRPQTDLDRRLAEFQAQIDATPTPMKELTR